MTETKVKPDQYAVFGDPIDHSKSPYIHQAFAKQTAQNLTYTKQQVNGANFNEAARRFFETGGKGLNITAPCKLEAYAFASELTERAERAGAVNTLIRTESGKIVGDTSDGVGLVSDIVNNLKWGVEGKDVLILGAGGAVRGVLEPLLLQEPKSLLIANRTASKAQTLANYFSDIGNVELEACGFEELEGRQFDLVINGTSASLSRELPPLPHSLLAPEASCYDMTYASEPTVFLRWAAKNGAQACADGLGMLVGQAAESFKLWRGVEPETSTIIEKLRESM